MVGLPEADLLAVGLSTVTLYPGLPYRYVATYHVKDVPGIMRITGAEIISYVEFPGVRHVKRHTGPTGSSALLGTLWALAHGYQRIVLCGCPLQGKNKFGGDYYRQFHSGWRYRYEEIKNHVRSMSGWTSEFLGKPTEEWLYGAKCDEAPAVLA